MKTSYVTLAFMILTARTVPVFGQSSTNCFLNDYSPKEAEIPYYADSVKTTDSPTVTVVMNAADTIARVSPYLLGNAAAVWVGASINNPTMVNYINLLSPNLIRFPGGSWSDIYFWNGNPGDLPDSLPDGNTYNYSSGTFSKYKFTPQFGPNQALTPDGYYGLREKTGTEGLITVNYAYARYGQSAHPVEQAAHLAADWVRYDSGRTRFWEIGNENNRPWEAGFTIDTSQNKDGQPPVISGTLYAKHFKIFADSMKAAAKEVGATIYIGGQINQYDDATDWIVADRGWNKQFYKEVGDTVDFYVIHDYFGSYSTTISGQVSNARRQIDADLSFDQQDISKYGADRPIAMTEWNTQVSNNASWRVSIANGMQAVVVFCEMARYGAGMSSRWLLANWDTDGMFYYKSPAGNIPLWNPRPAFYYVYFLRQFLGDHVVGVSVQGGSGMLAYATTFSSGQTGLIVVNTGSAAQVVKVEPRNIGVGDRYYVYILTGSNNSALPQTVAVNGDSGAGTYWGPVDGLESIPAAAYSVDEDVRFDSPPYSVEYVMIDSGSAIISSAKSNDRHLPTDFRLNQNYPNPFNPTTVISYQLPVASHVTLKLYDVLGRETATLVNARQNAGVHSIAFNAAGIPSGVYLYELQAGDFREAKKLVVLR